MEIGRYADGRAVTYDEAAHEFHIEGIRTTPELLMRYDNAGQIVWASDQMRAWVQSAADSAAAQAQAAAEFAATPDAGMGAASTATPYASPSATPYASPTPSSPAQPGVGPGFGAAANAYGDAGAPSYSSRYGLSEPHQRVTPSTTNVLGRRYVAFFIDSMIAWFGVFIYAIVVGVIAAVASHGNRGALSIVTPFVQVTAYVLFFAYFVVGEARWGTTPAKRMFGLHVLRVDGGRITLLQAFLRNIMLLIDTLFFTLPAFFSAKNSELHQRLGDRVADTVVIAQE